MYAIVNISGKQYKAEKGAKLCVPKQSLDEGKKIVLDDVLMVNDGKTIKFGATVVIQEDETRKQSKYQLVGEYESDINNKKISINSPLARALIGKIKKDVVEVNSPKGTKIYTVISVKY